MEQYYIGPYMTTNSPTYSPFPSMSVAGYPTSAPPVDVVHPSNREFMEVSSIQLFGCAFLWHGLCLGVAYAVPLYDRGCTGVV